jgi:hypothetical protein
MVFALMPLKGTDTQNIENNNKNHTPADKIVIKKKKKYQNKIKEKEKEKGKVKEENRIGKGIINKPWLDHVCESHRCVHITHITIKTNYRQTAMLTISLPPTPKIRNGQKWK